MIAVSGLDRRQMIIGTVGSLLLGSACAGSSGQRRALLVGIDKYGGPGLPHLRNAFNDARLMADTCIRTNFDREPQVEKDVELERLREVVDNFFKENAEADARFLYFAGHGRQFRNANFLVPSTPLAVAEGEELAKTLEVDDLIRKVSKIKTGVTIMVFDTCRAGALRGEAPGSNRSLAAIGPDKLPDAHGCVVAFSTAPGGTASDNPRGKNGLYASRLAENMARDGMSIEAVLKRTGEEVENDSKGMQVPWILTNLKGNFCFKAGQVNCPR